MTKKVLFQGVEYWVEDWATYIAQNADGQIFVYEHEPRTGAKWHSAVTGRFMNVGSVGAPMVLERIR